MPIIPKTDRTPGQKPSGRFSAIIEQSVPAESPVLVSQIPVSENIPESPKSRTFTEGQPIRLDRGLWLRLKTLKLQQEGRGVKITLMELLDTAVAEYLTRNNH